VLVHNADCFDIIRYSENATGFEKHHGVLDVWAQAHNIPGYTSEAPPQTDEIYATQKLDSIATSSHVQDI